MPNVEQEMMIHLLHHVGKGGESVKEFDERQKEF